MPVCLLPHSHAGCFYEALIFSIISLSDMLLKVEANCNEQGGVETLRAALQFLEDAADAAEVLHDDLDDMDEARQVPTP